MEMVGVLDISVFHLMAMKGKNSIVISQTSISKKEINVKSL